MGIDLLNIDIVTINCKDPSEGILAIDHCAQFFNFGRRIIFTSQCVYSDGIETILINDLKSIDEYNDFVLRLSEYIDNEYVLIVQDDGFITNPKLWSDDFLKYDYIGAPWPSGNDSVWIDRQNPSIVPHLKKNLFKNRTGNGGFSLRSKKFLEYSSIFDSCCGVGEDTFLCIQKYEDAISYGIKFAPFDVALKFSHEIPFDDKREKWKIEGDVFDTSSHFGFHGKNFTNRDYLIALKNKK